MGEDVGLGARIDRRGRVVEDQYAGVGIERAGQCDALALSAGQCQSSFSDDGPVSVFECGHETVCAGSFGGRDDARRQRCLLVGGAVEFPDVGVRGDVGGDGVRVEEGLVEHHADRRPEFLCLHRGDVDRAVAVRQFDRAGLGPIEAVGE